MERSIEFFYDIGSPYSYLAATQIDAVAAAAGASVEWKPFLLGGVFKASGNDMPARVPAKARWMLSDLTLWAKRYGVPFVFPLSFPPNTVKAMRACVAARREGQAKAFSLALFRAYWVDGKDPSAKETMSAAAEAAGLRGDAIIAATEDQAIKDELRALTDDAVARGAFGAPTMFVGEQMLWGNDRLELLAEALRSA